MFRDTDEPEIGGDVLTDEPEAGIGVPNRPEVAGMSPEDFFIADRDLFMLCSVLKDAVADLSR